LCPRNTNFIPKKLNDLSKPGEKWWIEGQPEQAAPGEIITFWWVFFEIVGLRLSLKVVHK
jgi:hypothetical protein